ncbi:hypothetical protein [Paraburkholderia jirisanensis]
MKMPIAIRSYLASAKKTFRRRNRAPLENTHFNSADCIGFDVDDVSPQSSKERLGFALPGGANHRFDHNPFTNGIGTNNDAAAWMALGVAVGAFVLVFGGYVAIAGMGDPERMLRESQELAKRGTVVGMRWLPGDSASLPELPLAVVAPPVIAASESALVADFGVTPKPADKVAGAPSPRASQAKVAAAPVVRRDARLRPGDTCVDKNQRGCFRRYATKAPSADSINSALAAHHLLNDFDQGGSAAEAERMQHTPSTYLHHAATYQHH